MEGEEVKKGEEEMEEDVLTFEHNADQGSLMMGQTFYFSSERGVGENGIKDWIGICRYRCVVRYEEFEMSFTKSK